MRKKLVRKILHPQKIINKKFSKKPKFSLRYWVIGVLLLVITMVSGYYSMQTKTIIENYTSPLPIDINKVTVMSDSPEVNAFVAAAQVKKAAVEKAAQGEPEDADKLELDMQRAARQAAKATLQTNGALNMGILPTDKNGNTNSDASTIEKVVTEATTIGLEYVQNLNYQVVDGETITSVNLPRDSTPNITESPSPLSTSEPIQAMSSVNPTVIPHAVEDSFINNSRQCSDFRGNWSESEQECSFTFFNITPPPVPESDSDIDYPDHPYIDFEERAESCAKLKGVYDPVIDHCKTVTGGWLDNWVENERRRRSCDQLKGTYFSDVGYCKLPASGWENVFQPYFIPTNLDYSDPINYGVLGESADYLAETVSRCQRDDHGSGSELYTCICGWVDCSSGSAGHEIATYLATNSQDTNGISDMDLVKAIVSKTTDVNSPICGSTASEVNKNCLPKEPNGWYTCENPTELYADDIVVISGDTISGEQDHIGICTDGTSASTCNIADTGFFVGDYAAVHPVSTSEVERVIRKLTDQDYRASGCWASSNIKMEDYAAPNQ